MKRTRYALTVVLCLFALGTLGYYYAFASDERLPPFQLVTVEGDAKEGAALELSGTYGGRMYSKPLIVTSEGSVYRHQETLAEAVLDSRSWLLGLPGLKEIRKEHPNFMRGKSSTSGWYEDKEKLIYADAVVSGGQSRTARLDAELLDLKSGKTSRFSVPLPDQKYDFAFVEDVQRIGERTHVLVAQRKLVAGTTTLPTDYVDYVLNLSDGSLIDRKKLEFDSKTVPGAILQTGIVSEEKAIAPSDYAILQLDQIVQKQISPNVASDIKFVDGKLYSYSYSTGELKELPSPYKPGDTIASVFHTLHGNVLNSLRPNGVGLTWTRKDVGTGRQTADLSVTGKQLGSQDILTAFVAQGRVNALLYDGDTTTVAVLDADSGKLLYRGKVVSVDPKRNAEEELKQLQLNNLNRCE